MTITLRYFAALRETLGRDREEMELGAAMRIGDLRTLLATREPTLAPLLARCVAARNRTFADDATPLVDGDEVAFIPPMAGGAS